MHLVLEKFGFQVAFETVAKWFVSVDKRDVISETQLRARNYRSRIANLITNRDFDWKQNEFWRKNNICVHKFHQILI